MKINDRKEVTGDAAATTTTSAFDRKYGLERCLARMNAGTV